MRQRPAFSELPALVATPRRCRPPARTPRPRSPRPARTRRSCRPGHCTRSRGRWRSRGSTSACTTRRTSPPARRWGSWSPRPGVGDVKVGIVGLPNAGKSPLQRADARGRRSGQLPVHDVEPNVAVVPCATPGSIAWPRRSARRTSSTTPSTSTTSPVSSRARTRARARQQVPREHPRDRRARPRRPRPRGPDVVHPEATSTRSGTSRRSNRAPLRRPRAGRAPPRSRRARGRGPARRRVAEEAWLRAVIDALQRAAGPLGRPRPRARPRPPQPIAADVQARPLRRERQEGTPMSRSGRRPCRGGGALVVAVSSRLEAELSELDDDEAASMREELGAGPSSLAASSPARSPCSTAHVLHGGRGEGRRTGTSARPDRMARSGRDPHRHPEGVRPGGDHRLGGAGRGRRLRRGPVEGDAAARGPRLPMADGDVITVRFTPSTSLGGSRPAVVPVTAGPRRRAPTASGGPAALEVVDRLPGHDLAERAMSSAPSSSDPVWRGVSMPGSAAASNTPSSVLSATRRSRAVFSPMPFTPGGPWDGSPRSAMKSGTCSGSMPSRRRTSAGPISSGPSFAAPPRGTDGHLVVTHWNMSHHH